MSLSTEAIIEVICVHLDVESPLEIAIEPTSTTTRKPMYRAKSSSTWTYVDRIVAVHLRERGAVWNGDVVHDPCAVA